MCSYVVVNFFIYLFFILFYFFILFRMDSGPGGETISDIHNYLDTFNKEIQTGDHGPTSECTVTTHYHYYYHYHNYIIIITTTTTTTLHYITITSFIYLGSVVHNKGGSRQEVLQWIGRPDPRCYGLTQHEYLALLVPVQTDKYLNL